MLITAEVIFTNYIFSHILYFYTRTSYDLHIKKKKHFSYYSEMFFKCFSHISNNVVSFILRLALDVLGKQIHGSGKCLKCFWYNS